MWLADENKGIKSGRELHRYQKWRFWLDLKEIHVSAEKSNPLYKKILQSKSLTRYKLFFKNTFKLHL